MADNSLGGLPDAEKAITLDVAQYNLSLVVEWIKHAETKATTILTFDAALLGLSLTEIPSATKVVSSFITDGDYFLAAAIVLLHIAFYTLLAFSVYHALKVVRPKLVRQTTNHSWFFFQSMSLFDATNYKAFCSALQKDTVLDQLNDQIYNNSCVASRKYAEVSTALTCLVVAGTLAIVGAVPVLIIEVLLDGIES